MAICYIHRGGERPPRARHRHGARGKRGIGRGIGRAGYFWGGNGRQTSHGWGGDRSPEVVVVFLSQRKAPARYEKAGVDEYGVIINCDLGGAKSPMEPQSKPG